MHFQGRKKWIIGLILLVTAALISGCGTEQASPLSDKTKIGIMLSDVGLGDQSFSDAAFRGLMKARDENGIIFDYKEISKDKTYDDGFEELAQENCDLIVGLGFMVKDSMEKSAKQHPDQQFLLIDETSDLPNIASITFKEEEGSFLAGALAAMASRTNHVGFIGGVDAPVIHKFQAGFEQGVKMVDPDMAVDVKYAGDFGKADLGASIAKQMIGEGADVIYTAAGFTGVGALQEAVRHGAYAIGVDSDQYFVAEKAVISSMMKNVDVAVYKAVIDFEKNGGKFAEQHMVFGLMDNGVGLAPIRVISLMQHEQKQLDELKQKLVSGEITVQIP
ncbi:BMP family protein [Paenibacillus aurantiacus]|uniref:BMP family protein n=1 Tax=Paenibacillus aurantiacus TaxID=1936118 RepID=A0ABV5KK53_9BACL